MAGHPPAGEQHPVGVEVVGAGAELAGGVAALDLDRPRLVGSGREGRWSMVGAPIFEAHDVRAWLAWTAATFAGFTLGARGAELVVGWGPTGSDAANAVLAWLLWGGVAGGLQGLALRLDRRSVALWSAATAAALAVSGGWWLLPAALHAPSPNADVVAAALYWGLVPGVLLGAAQAPLLRARTRHAALWVAAGAAGWAPAAAVGFLVWREVRVPAAWLPLAGMIHFYTAFLIGGMLTGAALVLLLRRGPVERPGEVPAA